MPRHPRLNIRRVIHCVLPVALAAFSGASLAQAPIIQPGAPGQPSREITAEDAIALAVLRYSADDVKFMKDMIPHHEQALEMSALVAERTGRNAMIELARRIDASQRDEIAFMQNWLRERAENVPEIGAAAVTHGAQQGDHQGNHHGDHPGHGHAQHAHSHHDMEGMATPEQMAELASTWGDAFDTLFLQLMIFHHQGALTMVEKLLEQEGAAQEPALREFTTHVTKDQEAEIERMTAMLSGFSPDPRVGLATGFRDAGEALLNMSLVASLPKPAGFFDPENPAGLPPSRLRALAADESADESAGKEKAADADEDTDEIKPEDRPPLLDFALTDMAFSGDLLVVGSYHGFKLYDIGNGGMPELVSSVVCPGGQGDVSVAGNLLILSVEQNRGRLDCGLLGVAGKVSGERFRGLRIFDISDPARPVQVGAVQTCRGSHTHTVVAGPGEDGRLIVYNSGIAAVRDGEELEGCRDESPWRDEGTALFRIDVIEIPIDRPQDARIIGSPAVFADPETGALAGLWEQGDHGPRTQTTAETNHCHDITVFPELGIAAGACSGNGILFDVSDPLEPKRIHEVVDPGFAYWHSATFNNDGTRVIFTDEWGGGVRPRCRASDPPNWGANAIYDIVDRRLVFRGYFKMPAPQGETENCVAHNGSLVPVPGRDIMVQAWYQGGISVFDFTDPANPLEIAFFDRGPIDAEALVPGGFWSAYWHRGLVYGTEIVRGLDVLAMLPSDALSANEIAAAALAVNGSTFNPQQQYRVSWPAEPVVVRAYQDQLLRSGRLAPGDSAWLTAALDRAELLFEGGRRDAALAVELRSLAGELARQGRSEDGATRTRLIGIGETLDGLAARLD
jgi:uncharacterized protein (DUF305 family)